MKTVNLYITSDKIKKLKVIWLHVFRKIEKS